MALSTTNESITRNSQQQIYIIYKYYWRHLFIVSKWQTSCIYESEFAKTLNQFWNIIKKFENKLKCTKEKYVCHEIYNTTTTHDINALQRKYIHKICLYSDHINRFYPDTCSLLIKKNTYTVACTFHEAWLHDIFKNALSRSIRDRTQHHRISTRINAPIHLF